MISGRTRSTLEDVSAFCDRTVALVLTGCAVRDEVTRLLDAGPAPGLCGSMHQWMLRMRAAAEGQPASVGDVYRYVVAARTLESGFSHYWRQMTHISAELESALLRCVENARRAIGALAASIGARMRFTRFKGCTLRWAPPWFRDAYSGLLVVPSDETGVLFWGKHRTTRCVLQVKTAPSLRHEDAVVAAACGAVIGLNEACDTRVFVLLANLGKVFEVHTRCSHFELLHRLIRRKMGMSWCADTMKADLEHWERVSFF